MIPIELLNDGNILISGAHSVNNQTYNGTNLIQFKKNNNHRS